MDSTIDISTLTLAQAEELIGQLQVHIDSLNEPLRIKRLKIEGKKWLKHWLEAALGYESYDDSDVIESEADCDSEVMESEVYTDKASDSDVDFDKKDPNKQNYKDLSQYVFEHCDPKDFMVRQSHEVRKRSTHVYITEIAWLTQHFGVKECSVSDGGSSWFETETGCIPDKYRRWEDIKPLSIDAIKTLIDQKDWPSFKTEMTTYLIRHGFDNMGDLLQTDGLFVDTED